MSGDERQIPARAGARVLLSFDAEEFDLPREYGHAIGESEQLLVGAEGWARTLDLLDLVRDRTGALVIATFFCTAKIARHRPDLVARCVRTGHEVASHGMVHGASEWRDEHLAQSRAALSEVAGVECVGFRRPRLTPTDAGLIASAGYAYDSGSNPTWVPGRYNGLGWPRLPHRERTPAGELLRIPASVTPWVRFPLFWLSFKAVPLWASRAAAARVLSHDPALVLYFHPWELCELGGYRLPRYITRCDGERMSAKLGRYLQWLAGRGVFQTYRDFAATCKA